MARIRVYYDETDGDTFPPRCVWCGEETDRRVANTFAWMPGWVNILLFAGLGPWLIVMLILRKSMRVTLPVCDAHRGSWRNRRLYVWLGLTLWVVYGVALAAVFSSLPENAKYAGMGVLLVGVLFWLVGGLFYAQSGVRPREITRKWIELIKVNARFADEWNEMEPPPEPRRSHRGGTR